MQEERQMVSKLQTDYKQADDVLKATYNRLYAETDGQVRTTLVKSQQAWIAFREENARMRANYGRVAAPLHDGALASTTMLYSTLTEMTKLRTKELEDIHDAILASQNAAKKP